MGEAFLHNHTGRFKSRRDAALPRFCETNLFASRPELFFRSFNCEPCIDVVELTGQRVFLIATDSDGVEVQLGGAIIGRVQDSDSEAIRQAMTVCPECAGMLDAYVDDQAVTGDFTVRLPRDTEGAHNE